MKLRKKPFTGQTSTDVTERELIGGALARRAASEGFVLLENKDHLLPIAAGTKLGLYGAGAVMTIKGGTGSGDVNERHSVTIVEGLKNGGFEITSDAWLEDYKKVYAQAREDWKAAIFKKEKEEFAGENNSFFYAYSSLQFNMPCGNPIDEAAAKADGADTAVFVLSRIAGENKDRTDTKGDYFVTDEEKALLSQVCACYDKVILIINTGGLLDLAFVDEYENITAILQFMQAGQEGGNALADVLTGKVTPSGKMTDSWAKDYYDYPNANTFSYKSGDVLYERYHEGIYVGYRYFDTFDVPVRYSFGYGLSYTDFDIQVKDVAYVTAGRPTVKVTVSVTNTGSVYAGKEVVQIYAACPQTKLAKEYRRLAGFGKTRLLAPGESQELTISFALEQLTSYDEAACGWTLEQGAYGLFVGNSLASAKISAVLILNGDVMVRKTEHICPLQEDLEEIAPDSAKVAAKTEAWQKEAKIAGLPVVQITAASVPTEIVTYAGIPETFPGKAGEITESLSVDQLVAFAAGDPGLGQGSALGSAGQNVPGAAAETTYAAEADPWNVAGIVLADGPAGLRLNKTYEIIDGVIQKTEFIAALENGFFATPKEMTGEVRHQYCTAIPVGTLLAQTWDLDLIREIGTMIGHEMNLFEVTLWLAPGMNIHRNPLCGRNFEYYSEDPLLAGMMAAAMTQGVQKVPGCGTTIKHFCCNNQEDNRMGSDSILSERTLREIYLKGFEIAVRDAQPMSIMTSYNMVNGVHAANCYDICTKAARDEWGFAGTIMTDWTTTTDSTAGVCTASGCVRAGNDLVMPGDLSDFENIRAELAAGTLSVNELKRNTCRTINVILQSNQYEDQVSYHDQFEGLGTYMKSE